MCKENSLLPELATIIAYMDLNSVFRCLQYYLSIMLTLNIEMQVLQSSAVRRTFYPNIGHVIKDWLYPNKTSVIVQKHIKIPKP